MKNGNDLQLLVCSANLGNACPDNESLSYWIPTDGNCLEVFRGTRGATQNGHLSRQSSHRGGVGRLIQLQYPIRKRSDIPETYCGSGIISSAVKNRIFELEKRQRKNSNDSFDFEDDFDPYTESDQFDIIVIGMQEATFDPPSKNNSSSQKDSILTSSEWSATSDAKRLMKKLSSNEAIDSTDFLEAPALESRTSSQIILGAAKDAAIFTAKGTAIATVSAAKVTASATVSAAKVTVKGAAIPMKQVKNIQALAGPSRNHAPKYSFSTKSDQSFRLPSSLNGKQQADETSEANKNVPTNESDDAHNQNLFNTATKLMVSPITAPMNVLSSLMASTDWLDGTPILHKLLDERLSSYQRIISNQRGEMRLEVYVHKSQLDVEVLKVDGQNTGRAGLANKGGIVAELLIAGKTKLSFLTAHLEAHEGNSKYQIRCKTISDILDGTKSSNDGLPDISCTSHYSFVMGDLNFRTELPDGDKLDEDEHKNIVNELVKNKDWDKLNEIDELGRALRNKDCLVGFQTLFCNFPPTFKVQRQKGYEYNEKRRPSYTDRILWKAGHGLDNNIKPILYEPIDDFASSDHKPIRCAFTIQMNERVAFRPKLIRYFHGSGSNISGTSSSLAIGRPSLLFHPGKDNSPVIPYQERLHLFVSDLKCIIDTDCKQFQSKVTDEIDTYVCFMSDPEQILRNRPKKTKWKKMLRMFGLYKELSNSQVTSKGWPRTSTQENTNRPDWSNEQIHFVVNTHLDDGESIDLTGAMMHITVFDANTSSPVGSFTFNLVHMIKQCKPSLHDSIKEPSSGRSLFHSQRVKVDAPATDAMTKTRSIINLFNRNHGGKIEKDGNHDEDATVAVQLDEALTLNGCETGHICCRLEARWIDEKVMRSSIQLRNNVQKERAPQ